MSLSKILLGNAAQGYTSTHSGGAGIGGKPVFALCREMEPFQQEEAGPPWSVQIPIPRSNGSCVGVQHSVGTSEISLEEVSLVEVWGEAAPPLHPSKRSIGNKRRHPVTEDSEVMQLSRFRRLRFIR